MTALAKQGGGASKVRPILRAETRVPLIQRFYFGAPRVSGEPVTGAAADGREAREAKKTGVGQSVHPRPQERAQECGPTVSTDQSARPISDANNFRRADVLFGQREIMAALRLTRAQTMLLIERAAFPTTLLADRRCALRADVDNWISDQTALFTWADDGGPQIEKGLTE